MIRRPYRLRTLLLGVALAGVVAWAASLPLRARSYRLRAAVHAAQLAALREDLRYARMMLDDLAWYQPALSSDLAHWNEIHRAAAEKFAHHARWQAIYLEAGKRPWIPVPVEPPAPSGPVRD